MIAPIVVSTPDLQRRVQPRTLGRWANQNFGTTTPERLTGIIQELESGEFTRWADFAEYMTRTDPHLHAVYESRKLAVSGADWEITPGRGDEQLAEAGAEFCRQALGETEELERIFSDMMHGVGLGLALHEHNWKRRGGAWLTTPLWVHPRECKFEPDWTVAVRNAADGSLIRCADMPGKFIVHIPRPSSSAPNVSGELLVIAWDWLFKRWARKLQLVALDKFANPFIYGELQPNTDDVVRAALLSNLQNLSSDQVAVFEAGTGVKIAEISKVAGEGWANAIESLNAEITKSLLGSTLNTEIGESGGNRAAAESQADNTILPRARSDAKRMAGTIERDWLRPLLAYNAHLFGGKIPPTPHFEFKLTQDEPALVDDLLVRSKAVTIDELRVSRGLEPWGPDYGGENVITSDAGTPIFQYHMRGKIVSRDDVRKQLGLEPLGGALGSELLDISDQPSPDDAALMSQLPTGGAATDIPLAQGMSRRPKQRTRSTARKTSQTSLPFQATQTDRALSALLVDRLSSPFGTRSKP